MTNVGDRSEGGASESTREGLGFRGTQLCCRTIEETRLLMGKKINHRPWTSKDASCTLGLLGTRDAVSVQFL
jgi:hypothetical protein